MTLVVLAVIVFAAFVVEATLGFGATIVTVTLGAFFVPLDVLLPAFVPINVLLSTALVLRYRKDVSWRMLLRGIVPLMAAGMPLGFAWFALGNHASVIGVFGIFVVVLSVLELVRMRRAAGGLERPLARPARWALLFAGGVVHGAYATGGPMAVYVAGRDLPDKGAFRSTLCMLWLVLNVILVTTYAIGGDLSGETGRISAVFVVPLALGLAAGDWLHGKADPRLFRVGVFVLLAVAGLVLAAR